MRHFRDTCVHNIRENPITPELREKKKKLDLRGIPDLIVDAHSAALKWANRKSAFSQRFVC